MTVCNREEKGASNTLDDAINSLIKSGIQNSKIEYKIILHDSGSLDTSYLDKYSNLPNFIVVKNPNKAGILKNSVYMMDYICNNISADYFLYIEDDITFCKNWLENVDAWISKNIKADDTYFSFYCPIEHKKLPNTNVFLWDVTKYYGTQCFGVPFKKLNSLLEFFSARSKEGYGRGNDIFLAKWSLEIHNKQFIKTSHPSLVQHMATGSTLDSFLHQSPYFPGEDKDPEFTKKRPESNVVCGIGSGVPELVYHFMKYYTDLGVDKFHLAVHAAKEDENLKKTLDILEEFGVVPVKVWVSVFSEDVHEKNLSNIRNSIKKDDWILNLDTDEFLKLPINFSGINDFLQYCDNNGYRYITGNLIDRVSKTGEFIQIRKDEDIFSQFPLEYYVTGGFGGCINKVPAMKSGMGVCWGHHFILGDVKDSEKYPNILDIDHFKWDITIVDRLENFFVDGKVLSEHYYSECNKLLNYAKENKRINIDNSFFQRKMSRISLCTAIMDRLEFLKEALPTWLKLPFDEIIIVDWSSRIPVAEHILKDFKDERIKIIRVDGKEKYNQSKASNLKIMAAKCPIILSIDCDIKLGEDFFKRNNFVDGIFIIGDQKKNPGTTGTCLVSKSEFDRLNGYNELMNGWGYHDNDFYNRLENIGLLKKYFANGSIIHIDHGDEIRTSNYTSKNKKFSNHENKKIAIKKPWGVNNTMEKNSVKIFYSDGKIENKVI